MSNTLVDIRDVDVNINLPVNAKAKSFINQIKNPYHFKFDKYEVTVGFIGNERLEDKIIKQLSKK